MISKEMEKVIQTSFDAWLTYRSDRMKAIFEDVSKDLAPLFAVEIKKRIEALIANGDVEAKLAKALRTVREVIESLEQAKDGEPEFRAGYLKGAITKLETLWEAPSHE